MNSNINIITIYKIVMQSQNMAKNIAIEHIIQMEIFVDIKKKLQNV